MGLLDLLKEIPLSAIQKEKIALIEARLGASVEEVKSLKADLAEAKLLNRELDSLNQELEHKNRDLAKENERLKQLVHEGDSTHAAIGPEERLILKAASGSRPLYEWVAASRTNLSAPRTSLGIERLLSAGFLESLGFAPQGRLLNATHAGLEHLATHGDLN
jgi:hypothetical protein